MGIKGVRVVGKGGALKVGGKGGRVKGSGKRGGRVIKVAG